MADRDTSSTAGLGVIYWLDSVQKNDWPRDLAAIRDLGASCVIFADWFDLPEVFAEEPEYIRHALDLCKQHELKAYLHIFPAAQMLEPYPIHILGDWRFNGGWSGYRRSHPKYSGGPTHRFVDAFGYEMPLYDLLSRRWREEWLLPYLDGIARHYGDAPALAGYELSDLLLLPMLRADVAPLVSYSGEDASRFRQWRSENGKSPVDPPVLAGRWSEEWNDWMAARRAWLAEFTAATCAHLRRLTPGKSIVVHDEARNLVWFSPLIGGYTQEMLRPFDAFVVHHYLLPSELNEPTISSAIADDAQTAASLLDGVSPGWRLPVHTHCRDAFPAESVFRQVFGSMLRSAATRIELDCYRRPRVPGHIFDHGQTLAEHPEVHPVVRELASLMRGGPQ